MAEPFEVGGVVVRVRVVADDVQQAANKAVAAVQKIGKTGQQVSNELEQAAKQTRSLAQAAQQASSATAAVGKSSGELDKYAAKLEKLNAQYDLQNRKVLQLQESLDSMVQQYAALQAATGGSMDFMPEDVAPDLTARYDAELAKLDALRNSIRQTEQARTEAAAKAQAQQDAAIQKQEQLNQKMADKRSTNNTKVGMNTAAAAIRTVSNAAGGAVGNIGYLASEIIYLKEQMHLAQTASTSMAVGISGGIMMAVTLITTIASKISQARAQELQAAKDAAAAYQAVNEETVTAQRNLDVLQDQASTTAEVRDAKEALAQQFPELVAGWDEEGNAILANNDAIKTQIEYLEQLDAAKQASAAASVGTLTKDMNKQIQEIAALNYLLYDTEKTMTGINNARGLAYGVKGMFVDPGDTDKLKKDLADARVEYLENLDAFQNSIIADLNEKTGDPEVAAAMSTYISKTLGSFVDAQATGDAFGTLKWEDISKNFSQHIIDVYNQTFETIPSDIQDMISNLNEELKPAYSSLFFALQGGEINMDDFSTAIRTLASDNLQPIIVEFENLHNKITDFTATDQDIERYNQILAQLQETCKLDADTFGALSNATLETSDALRQAAINAEAAESTYLDMAKSVNDAYSSLKSFRDDLSDIGQLEAVKQALDAGTGTKNYADALEYLAQEYGVTKEEAAGMAGQLQEEIQLKKDIAAASILLAKAEAQAQVEIVNTMYKMDKITQEQSEAMTNALKGVIQKYDELVTASGQLNESSIRVSMPEVSSSSAKSTVNEALNEQLQLLSRKKAMDNLTYAEEIAWLKKIRSQYAKTTDEKADLDEKLYAARKQQENAWYAYLKSMDQLTLQEEIDHVREQINSLRDGVEERRNLEVQLHELLISQEQSELEYKKSMNQLTLQEEKDMLEKQLDYYKSNSEARKKLEQEIYQLKIKIWNSEIEYQKNMGQLSTRQEISKLYQQLRLYEKGTEEYKNLQAKIHQMESDVMQSEIDHQKAMGELSLEQEETLLERRLRLFEQGTEGYNQIEEQLYEVRQQIRERDAQNIDTVADGIIEALQNKYEAQKQAEMDRLDESAAAWEKWGEEQTEAIQNQIDALDDLTESEDRAEEEAKKLRKISMLEQQLQYEQDNYNKVQLQKQLDAAREELEKWRKEKEREDLRSDLEEQKDAVNKRVEAEKEAIQNQKEALEKEYESLLEEKKLQAEAEKLLLQNNQSEIIQLLKEFAPEYEMVGQTLGEKLAEGFEKTVGGSITTWFDNLTQRITQYQTQMAQTAMEAADNFWIGRQNGTGGPEIKPPSEVVQNITVHFNQPVNSPIEEMRELKRVMEQAAKLIV